MSTTPSTTTLKRSPSNTEFPYDVRTHATVVAEPSALRPLGAKTTAPPPAGPATAPGGLRAAPLRQAAPRQAALRGARLTAAGLRPASRPGSALGAAGVGRPGALRAVRPGGTLRPTTSRPHRRVIFTGPLDQPRPQPGARSLPQRYLLEYSDICRLMDWYIGDQTYQVGMSEDFTWLALAAVEREWECIGELECDYLRDGWCLNRTDEHTHAHPLGVGLHESGSIPLDFSEIYDYRCEALDESAARRWAAVAGLIVDARRWALEHVDEVLGRSTTGVDVAVATLRLAGFGIQDGAHSRADLHAAFRLQLLDIGDPELRNAYADWVAINLPHHLADESTLMRELDHGLEDLERDDAAVLDPNELQWLAFTPADVPVPAGGPGQLLGLWTATKSRYLSLFDEELDQARGNYPLVLGWREIDMTHGPNS